MRCDENWVGRGQSKRGGVREKKRISKDLTEEGQCGEGDGRGGRIKEAGSAHWGRRKVSGKMICKTNLGGGDLGLEMRTKGKAGWNREAGVPKTRAKLGGGDRGEGVGQQTRGRKKKT